VSDVAQPVVRVDGVSKRFSIRKDKSLKERLVNFRRSAQHAETFWALRDVSFELEPATTLALIGHNGSGKSTLLKMIGGIIAPTTGKVERRGRLAALLELGAGFHGDLTGRENVYLNASILGISRSQTDRYFDQIVDFSGIEEFIDTQVKFYSSGMYVRLAFAVAVHVDPEIMLVDEVLAVGDEPFQRKCLERIKRFQQEGRTIVLVTHGLDQVNQLCDRAIVLDHGQMVIDGTPKQAVRTLRDRYAEQEEIAEASAAGTPPVRITGVRVLDSEGTALRAVDSGGTVVLEIDVEARERCPEWVVGIALQNHMDLLVYGTNTRLLGYRLPPMAHRRTARFVLPSLPLVDGQYYVTAAVHPPVGPEWHRLDRTATFRINSEGAEEGVLHVEPKFEVVDS
jgi:ABC-2 type transport system ATP-binding protein